MIPTFEVGLEGAREVVLPSSPEPLDSAFRSRGNERDAEVKATGQTNPHSSPPLS